MIKLDQTEALDKPEAKVVPTPLRLVRVEIACSTLGNFRKALRVSVCTAFGVLMRTRLVNCGKNFPRCKNRHSFFYNCLHRSEIFTQNVKKNYASFHSLESSFRNWLIWFALTLQRPCEQKFAKLFASCPKWSRQYLPLPISRVLVRVEIACSTLGNLRKALRVSVCTAFGVLMRTRLVNCGKNLPRCKNRHSFFYNYNRRFLKMTQIN